MGPDKYESVLGLPPGPRPPNHYELLGIALCEPSAGQISAAAERRVTEAEESVMASAENIRQVIAEITAAKTCLLSEATKAQYDRQLRPDAASAEPAPPADADLTLEPPLDVGSGQESPQFEPLLSDVISAARPARPRGKFRLAFWTFTLLEAIGVAALLYYLRPLEPIEMPGLPVRNRAPAEAVKPSSSSGDPPAAQAVERIAPNPNQSSTPARSPAQRSLASTAPDAPSESPEERSPVLTDPDMIRQSPVSVPNRPAAVVAPPSQTYTEPVRPQWPTVWKFHFTTYGDWTIDNELLALSADEVKSLAALREQPLYTLREAGTKKPLVALPFDKQGHLSGVVAALLPQDGWRACLSYNNQVLQGFAMVLDAHGECVFFAEYRNKGRSRLLCLAADGFPLAVQIWSGKESTAYLLDLADGQPVAREQKDLSPEQAERLAAALSRLAAIETLIHDCQRDWKAQLSAWWLKHDGALKTISALPIDEGEKQARKTAYYKKLFDEQHAGLDALLGEFSATSAASTSPAPPAAP